MPRPYFYNQDANIPSNEKVPQLHRYTAGGTLGGALIKDKLFGFASYQHIHASDLEIGTSRTAVPSGLTDDRSAAALANVDSQPTGDTDCESGGRAQYAETLTGTSQLDPVAFALLNYKLPNGQYLFPSANPNFTPTLNFPRECFPHAAGIFHIRPGRHRSRLSAHHERHSLVEVLLPARSEHGAFRATLRSKVSLNVWTRAAR